MILDEEIFLREREGIVELNVIRESSRFTGINFYSFKCFSERTSLFSALFVDLKAFEDTKHHFTCKTF